jgi:hypothetical protein
MHMSIRQTGVPSKYSQEIILPELNWREGPNTQIFIRPCQSHPKLYTPFLGRLILKKHCPIFSLAATPIVANRPVARIPDTSAQEAQDRSASRTMDRQHPLAFAIGHA